MMIFCKKKAADISKIKGFLVLKAIFSKANYVCVLTCEMSVSYIVLLPPTTVKATPENPSYIRVKM